MYRRPQPHYRRHDPTPHVPPPPLPNDRRLRTGIEVIARYLHRAESARDSIAHAQEDLINVQYGIKNTLREHPGLAPIYAAFVGGRAGVDGNEWKRFAFSHSVPPGKKPKLRLVVDNTPPPAPEKIEPAEEITRVRIRPEITRVRIKPRKAK